MTKSENSKLKEELLKYIDIPYFKNNPAYISKWRKYYMINKNPQILLLMYHKQISTCFHWIYIELSTYLLNKNQTEIAEFVLKEALRMKVYDEKKIEEALLKIQNDINEKKLERKYKRGDLLAFLNQKNIDALGQIWNSFKEEFYYKNKLPEKQTNFELFKFTNYENSYGIPAEDIHYKMMNYNYKKSLITSRADGMNLLNNENNIDIIKSSMLSDQSNGLIEREVQSKCEINSVVYNNIDTNNLDEKTENIVSNDINLSKEDAKNVTKDRDEIFENSEVVNLANESFGGSIINDDTIKENINAIDKNNVKDITSKIDIIYAEPTNNVLEVAGIKNVSIESHENDESHENIEDHENAVCENSIEAQVFNSGNFKEISDSSSLNTQNENCVFEAVKTEGANDAIKVEDENANEILNSDRMNEEDKNIDSSAGIGCNNDQSIALNENIISIKENMETENIISNDNTVTDELKVECTLVYSKNINGSPDIIAESDSVNDIQTSNIEKLEPIAIPQNNNAISDGLKSDDDSLSMTSNDIKVAMDEENISNIIRSEIADKVDLVVDKHANEENFDNIYKIGVEANANKFILNSKDLYLDQENVKKIKTSEFNSFKNMFNCEYLQISGNLFIGSEIVIDRYIYLVQEEYNSEISNNNSAYSLLRIAKNSDITQTMMGKYYLLREATGENVLLAKRIFKCECCENNGKYYILFEHTKLIDLNSIINKLNSNVLLYYLRQVLECILNLREHDLAILSVTDFFIDQDFNLILNSFDFIPSTDQNIVQVELNLQEAFKNFKIEISYDYLSSISLKLGSTSAKKDILNHKTEILENL